MNGESQSTGTVSSAFGVHALPDGVRSLSTFAEPAYVDLFTITTPLAGHGSAEEWARTVLEQAPLARHNARALWRLMGLRLGPRGSPDFVQGWKIAGRGEHWIRGETSSWYLRAQVVCLVEEGQVSVSLSLVYDQPLIAALVWALISGPHRRAVPVMLHQAVKIRGSMLAQASPLTEATGDM